ncbi:MAG TPA: hypothetical protein VF533_06085 [Solirubrobacteraceae bacterium]|jgi:hypothetical protein
MDREDRMRVVLGQLALRDAASSINLKADADSAEAFKGPPGFTPDEIHRAFKDACSAGLMHGKPFEGDGSMRRWDGQPRPTLAGLASLGMWPSTRGPLRDDRWWKRGLRVLQSLHQSPPHGGVLHMNSAPGEHLADDDEAVFWRVIEYLIQARLLDGEVSSHGAINVALTPAGERAIAGTRGYGDPSLSQLTEGQQRLFTEIGEVSAGLPHHQREFSYGYEEFGGGDFISGADGYELPAIWNDLSKLVQAGLLEWTTQGSLGYRFVVTAKGEQAYREASRVTADRLTGVEEAVTGYLRGDQIAARYPRAYKRWLDAEQLLVSGRREDLTVVGHTAREAMQLFSSELISLHGPSDASPDPSKTVQRVRSVISMHKEQLGETKEAVLTALVAYWGTVSDLAQRLEHAAQKEGQPVSREDARQLVHLTAQVVFEIDRSLPRPSS